MILKCLKDHKLIVLEPEGNIFCQHFPFDSVRLHYYHNISYCRNMYSQSQAVYLNASVMNSSQVSVISTSLFQITSCDVLHYECCQYYSLSSKNGDLLYANTCFYFHWRRHRFTSYASIPPTPVIAAAIFGSSSPCSWMQEGLMGIS